ncbi:MAG: hypothetical protein VYE22_27910 [Myxococcota bacterium]|nr:hypothetical protein [Myxococcota bacterium]
MTSLEDAHPNGACRPTRSTGGGKAMVLGATLALGGVGIGGCALAGCDDPVVRDVKMPTLASATEPEEAGAPEEIVEPDLLSDEARLAELDLSPGFVPDPIVHTGETAGGPVDLDAFDDRCDGWAAEDPDLVLDAARPFAELAILVASHADTTLMVVGPDGEPRCADDTDGPHPSVRQAFLPGRYRVWVGTREPETRTGFVLALSELDDSVPSALLH